MGLLASFLENRKSGCATANRANSANPSHTISQISRISHSDPAKLEIATERKLAALATLAGAHRENQNCERGEQAPPAPSAMVASLEDRRAAVERMRDDMAREHEKRRDWHKQPVDGWREGRLEIHSVVTGETTVIRFPKPKGDRP